MTRGPGSRLPALVLEWEKPDSGERFRVAQLHLARRGWTFQYGYEIERAEGAGFPGLGGFSKEPRWESQEDADQLGRVWPVYESRTLFPSIRRRIPDLRRSDVQRLLRNHLDKSEEEQLYWYLRLYGGRQAADPFRFVATGEVATAAKDGLDEAIRRELRRTVAECRELLTEDFGKQLEGRYGIHSETGVIEPLDRLRLNPGEREARDAIEAAILHAEATLHCSRAEAAGQYLREAAFTTLNRLAALKLMEHPARQVIRESIGAGRQSKGLKQFQMACPEVTGVAPDGGYRRYLELLADDLAMEMAVLWDRTLPTSALFPAPGCLDQVTELLNDEAIRTAWGHDETIGWIYQYFTPKEQRDKARKDSPAPQNSYELAFRNQFYTPAYVVQFLTDNTLGRLWSEMRGGRTVLEEKCSYRLRTGNVQARARRDPRDVAVLDPACGSGHFLLYAFDLFRWIYEEAYEDADATPSMATGRSLREDFPDREALARALPGLILRHNLHGIDIDLRATQIAALALWLCAQRLAAELSPKGPYALIARINVVRAEPMPGERELFEEFLGTLHPPVLRTIAQNVWETLILAANAGSLLKVEQALRGVIADAKRQWQTAPPPEQMGLFGEARRGQQLVLDLSGITDAAFWDRAEARILEALEAYAERAAEADGMTRRIFAEDGAQGFKFVDLLLKSYDVVLMNPPFGAASLPSKAYIDQHYPKTRNDLYAAFVERGIELLRPTGYLGAITSRTGFFLTSFAAWRQEVLLGKGHLIAIADLGYGVLDTAMVETAAYVVERTAGDSGPVKATV